MAKVWGSVAHLVVGRELLEHGGTVRSIKGRTDEQTSDKPQWNERRAFVRLLYFLGPWPSRLASCSPYSTALFLPTADSLLSLSRHLYNNGNASGFPSDSRHRSTSRAGQ